MTIDFACDDCGQRYQVDASLAGRRIKCKKCERLLTIPAAAAAPPPIPGRPAAAPAFDEPGIAGVYDFGPEPGKGPGVADYYAPPLTSTAPAYSPGYVGPPGFRGYAGFWRRFAAAIIDNILIGIAANLLAGGVGLALGDPDDNPVVIVPMFLILFGIPLAYYAGMISSKYQATIGKMALGIVVTDLNGRRIGRGQAIGRELAKILSACILYIGFIMAGFTDRKQALHDMIAGTLVVMK